MTIMKIVRRLVITICFSAVIWLSFWVVPTLGIFRSAPSDPPLPQNGYALVLFKERKVTDSLPLTMVETGWSAVPKGWPFILIGILVGFPLGELARRTFAIDEASKEAIQKSEHLTIKASVEKLKAEAMKREVENLFYELPRLKNELAEAQKIIFQKNMAAHEQSQRYEELRRKNESWEKELIKARAKNRRLAEKADHRRGKSVDDEKRLE